MSKEFEKALEEALNSPTLTEVERDGELLVLDDYKNHAGAKIIIKIYRYKSHYYYIRYVNGECGVFRDLTMKE